MSLLISIHSSREGRYIVSYGYISFLSISIHTSREGRYSEKSYIVIWRYISIHSSHEGRYKDNMIFVYGNEHFNPLIPRREIHPLVVLSSHPWRNFNPLIPRREIQQYCTKIGCHILAVLPKTYLFSLSAAPETLKIPRISRESNLYPGANPPYFLCELLVRTGISYH